MGSSATEDCAEVELPPESAIRFDEPLHATIDSAIVVHIALLGIILFALTVFSASAVSDALQVLDAEAHAGTAADCCSKWQIVRCSHLCSAVHTVGELAGGIGFSDLIRLSVLSDCQSGFRFHFYQSVQKIQINTIGQCA